MSQDILLRHMTEAEFQAQIIELAHLRGWVVATFRPARVLVEGQETYRTAVGADGAGWPDLILAKPPRLLVVELKSEKGKLSPEQEAWLELLRQCMGVQVHVWRPSDWEEIVWVLSTEVKNKG